MTSTTGKLEGRTYQGIVYAKSLGAYTVHDDSGHVVVCAPSSLLRKDLEGWFGQSASTNIHRKVKDVREIRQVDPIAIGDCVTFVEAEDGRGMITGVLPRRNKLSRMEPGPQQREQIIVANADQIIPVVAARNPMPRWNLLDRHLATADAAGIEAVICITKIDLAQNDPRLKATVAEYRRIGYRVLLTSAETGKGIDAMQRVMRGKVSAVIGLSGVGKSTLLNAIQPGLGLRVRELNARIGKGRHTTTHLEMYPLDAGGAVIDTPGMKLFSLWDFEPEDIALHFREMRPYVGKCRFGLDCTHIHEPGCAMLDALEAGEISQQRYDSYVYLRDHMKAAY